MNQMIGITDWYVMPQISAPIVFQRLMAPRLGMPVDEARIAACIPLAQTCLAEISRLLGDRPFMAGDQLTIADLMLAPQMAYLGEIADSEDLLAPHPNLRDWNARMAERPSMRATTWERLTEAA